MDSRIQLAAVLAIDHLLEIPRSTLGCAAGCAKGFVASDTNLTIALVASLRYLRRSKAEEF